MKRLDRAADCNGTVALAARRKGDDAPSKRAGYTLVEMLVATALTLILMYAVVSIFADIGEGVNDSRAVLEMTERLRATTTRLQLDLAGITAVPRPPRRVEFAEGYLEIKEGPNLDWSVSTSSNIAWDTVAAQRDTTVGDFDDVLMFTTHSTGRPFRGRCSGASGGVVESQVAEVCWFVRGRNLYRRVMLVAPGAPIAIYSPDGFYARNDISVRCVFDTSGNPTAVVPNSLADLTKRENRFAHNSNGFPYDVRGWGLYGLPTLGECSHANWQAGAVTPVNASATQLDFWAANPYPSSWSVDPDTGTMTAYPGPRATEDVILTNVIGFDVKLYDPDMADYVDPGTGNGRFGQAPESRSGLTGSTNGLIYCTWSDHYERDGIPQLGIGTDAATNGFDDDGVNGVDDLGERDTMPPYPYPLRGIQVTIRVFEPDSQQVREMTVVQDFLPK